MQGQVLLLYLKSYMKVVIKFSSFVGNPVMCYLFQVNFEKLPGFNLEFDITSQIILFLEKYKLICNECRVIRKDLNAV